MPDNMNAAEMVCSLVEWIRNHVTEAEAKGVVYGLSGGLDSAVVGALCQRAFPKTSLGLFLQCYSLNQDLTDAKLVADALQLRINVIVLDQVYDQLQKLLDFLNEGHSREKVRLALANIKPRLRMIVLYYYAFMNNYLVVGGSNKSERAIGYFTKYGDGGCDLFPLGNLVKHQVRDLAVYLKVPDRIINKPPSAGLWENQTDEEELGISYAMLDNYLLGGDVPPDIKARIEEMKKCSEHKRRMPPIPNF
jgi:NAD+ synthase